MNFFTKLTQPENDSFACCHCRTVTNKANQAPLNICTNCGHAMYNMGAGFIAPNQANKTEWNKVALLVKHNFTFEYLSA